MSWCHLSYQADTEARRKSKAGEFLTDQESEYIARYSYQTPCCSVARPSKSAHLLTPLLTPLALTDVCHFVYISYHAGLSLKKHARLALDQKFMMDNPNIKQAALRSPGTTKSFSVTQHSTTILLS